MIKILRISVRFGIFGERCFREIISDYTICCEIDRKVIFQNFVRFLKKTPLTMEAYYSKVLRYKTKHFTQLYFKEKTKLKNKPENKKQSARTVKIPRKSWTVIIYLAGDNNLSEELIKTLQGLKNVGDTFQEIDAKKRVNILACYDSVYPTVRTRYYNFSNKSTSSNMNLDAYKLPQNNLPPLPDSLVKISDNESGFNQGKGIKEFVKYVIGNYPAENYFLILSGHGDAFRGKTLMFDENPPGGLSLMRLKSVLNDGHTELIRSFSETESAGSKKKFALLGFDSCAMGLLEIGYEFRTIADYFITSEGYIPQSGWEYEEPLKYLVKNHNASPGCIAKKFIECFSKIQFDYTLGGRSVDLSVCNLNKSQDVVDKLEVLAKILFDIYANYNKPSETSKLIQDTFTKLITYSHWRAQTYFYEQTTDLLDFCERLEEECLNLRKSMYELNPHIGNLNNKYRKLYDLLETIACKCRDIINQLEATPENGYILNNNWCGPDFRFSRGASIFLPWTRMSFITCDDIYKKLDIAKGRSPKLSSYWFKFIDRYTNATMRLPDDVPITEEKGERRTKRAVNLEQVVSLEMNLIF